MEKNYLEMLRNKEIHLEDIPLKDRTEEICLEAVRKNGSALQYVPVENFDDPTYEKICLKAIKQKGAAIQYVPEDKRTENICLQAVKYCGEAIMYVPEHKFNTATYEKMCLNAVNKNSQTLKYVLGKDFDTATYERICLETIHKNGQALEYIPKDKCTEELCLKVIKKAGYALKGVPEDERTEKLCLEAVRQDGQALQYVPVDKRTEELCLEAASQVKNDKRDKIRKLYAKELKIDLTTLSENELKEFDKRIEEIEEKKSLLKQIFDKREIANNQETQKQDLEAQIKSEKNTPNIGG